MKFYIKKLGCPKNDVDGDYITGRLIDAGHERADENDAEIVIINTCGFILPAREESIQEILRYEEFKKEGRIERLYVTGCLSQRYGRELLDEIENIDGIFGLGQIDDLVKAIDTNLAGLISIVDNVRSDLDYISSLPRFVDNIFPYEYLKIADGCDRFCSYCAIPNIRGRYRSRPIGEILDEAEMLVAVGKNELILVSQEGTGYGRDLDDGSSIIDLLQKLEKIAGVEWIRLMYLHPESITDELIEYMTFSDKTLGYFDIPLQHISDKILKMMNRKISRKIIEETLEKIRKKSLNNIIRTTFITGFPGETEKEFNELRKFVEDFEFERLGVFLYSNEEGTPANRLNGTVSNKLAEARREELMLLQQRIAFEKNIALIDSFQKVIIDRIEDLNLAEGRSIGDCPEIDQLVHVKGDGLKVGDIIDAKISAADGYDLIAEPLKR
ncbi:MAG TPA: 30S ribosomal protein S12 methylthiotransferase RimO [candidate division Zixibacteria bacterium]|nr:30S ribosomal protein S12 methylthiotransferase RimO [candidate division Zixibacteria bacterium]